MTATSWSEILWMNSHFILSFWGTFSFPVSAEAGFEPSHLGLWVLHHHFYSRQFCGPAQGQNTPLTIPSSRVRLPPMASNVARNAMISNNLFSFFLLFPPPKQQHTSLVGGSNPSCCPLCQKVCISGEDLMEHMKYVHKDPNASGVPGNQPRAPFVRLEVARVISRIRFV